MTFAEKKLPLDYIYVDDEMLVLNEQRVIEKKNIVKKSSVKKLTTANVNFLRSLGFVVRT